VRTHAIDQALVFTRTKHGANKLAEQLKQDGIATAAIHGNKSQPQRIRALNDFKAGRVTLLIATEVAARGIDIESLPHVVNFELPMVASDYLHRIGRTGRAGIEGDAISLVCVDEAPLLRDIERLLGSPIPAEVVAGFEPDRSIPAQAIRLRTGGGASGGGRGPRRQPAPHGQGRSRRPGRARPTGRPGASVGIGNRPSQWTSLPGERTRR
jgi:ATP-dependent RNA helicase RhlE